MRVPLGYGQFLNLGIDPSNEIHPAILASFPRLVESYFRSTFPDVEDVVEPGIDNVPQQAES